MTQDNGHTAGPWTAFESEINPGVWYVGTDHVALLRTDTSNNAQADATLAASAPALLEALETLTPRMVNTANPHLHDDVVVPVDMTMGEIRKARAAILSARGEAG